MRYLKPLRPFLAWTQLSIPTVYDDSLSYYEVLNKCIFHFNEMLKIMQENYEIIDEAFAKILEECEAAIARCEEAAARAEAAQSAAEKAQAAAEAAQAAAEAAQKLAEAAQAAAEAARDDAVTAQKAAEAAQAAAEAAQAAAEAAQQKAETAQAAAEAAQAKAEDAQEKAESARDAAQAAQTAAEAAQQKAEAAQTKAEAAKTAAESARDAAQAAQTASESARDAAQEAQNAAESARDESQAAQTAAEAAQNKAEAAQEAAEASEQAAANSATNAAESASNAAESASSAASDATNAAESAENASNSANQAAESATDAEGSANAAHTSETNAADSAADAAASAEEIKNALDNYYDKTESDATFVKKAGDTMTGNLVMENNAELIGNASTSNTWKYSTTEVQDLNYLKTPGIYKISGNTTVNSPSTANFDVIVLIKDESYIYTQIAISNTYVTETYIRVGNNSGFGKWFKFSTNNDLNNYLPLSGGTMSGKINVQDELNDTFTGLSKGNYVTTINEYSDLNNVKTNSINFYRTNIATSEESKNFPAKISGFLVSITKDASIRQIYYATLSNEIYTRIYSSSSSSWLTWRKISFEEDIVGNYLPLSGGTMTGNITMSDDTKLIGNAETSDFFKLIHIPNASDMNKIIESGFYAITSGDSVSNAPEEVSAENNAFSCFVFPWQYPNTTGISQLLFSGDGTTVKGVYLRLTNNPEVGWGNWVRLDNIVEEPADGTPIFYKRTYSTDNKFFANIYKIAGDESKAKVDIYVNNLDSGFNLSFSTDYETFPAIFKIDGTKSTFNGENLPFELKASMDLVVGNYMVEESSKYIGLVNLNYTISFSGYDSYIKPYFNGILLESSVLSRGTISGNNPVFITSFINDVNSRWTWD